jgi:putative tryptophan/tyrosine transport system substrate-binding protein
VRHGPPDAARLGPPLQCGRIGGAERPLGAWSQAEAIPRATLQPADALYVVAEGLISANRTRIITFALAARLPTIFNIREYAEAGGVMSYGPNFPDMFRRTAEIADRILRGAKPADIPVEQPTKFDLVFNLTTARALGVTVPPTLLARADEVIE